MSASTNRRRVLAGTCLVVLAVFLLSDPFTKIQARGAAPGSPAEVALSGFSTPPLMLLMVGSVLAILQLLRSRADRAGLFGGALVILGWAAGIRIMLLRQLEALLRHGVEGLTPETLTAVVQTHPIVWRSIVPTGILFPLGLVVLGLTLFVTRPVNRSIGALLALGGVLFPVGRIGSIAWAIAATDLLLGAAFGALGWLVLTRPALWASGEGRSAESRMVTASDAHPATAPGAVA